MTVGQMVDTISYKEFAIFFVAGCVMSGLGGFFGAILAYNIFL